jgi:hypothetical protein
VFEVVFSGTLLLLVKEGVKILVSELQHCYNRKQSVLEEEGVGTGQYIGLTHFCL